jgi:predicted transcriptional regulator of viral defense system
MGVRSLSPTAAKVVLSLEADGVVDLTLEELRRRARISPAFARKLAHDLVRKGWLQRVGRGRYLLNPSGHGPDAIPDTDPLRRGSRLVEPYYFGYATAAELLGLLPQASRVYYVVTPRPGAARWKLDDQFRLVRVRPERFFGVRTFTRRGETVTVSDRERTLVDALHRPEFSGGLPGIVRMLESAGDAIDWGRLETYLGRFGDGSLARRLGYLLERAAPAIQPPAAWLDRLVSRWGEAYVPLGPAKEFGRRGPHDPRWHLIRNVPDALLRAEVDVR